MAYTGDITTALSSLSGDPHEVNNDHSDVGKKSEGTHSHTFEHQHDDYPSHTHRGTHTHENPGETHSDPHDIDSSHTHVGKKVVIDPVKKTVTFDAHQHDDYVWHTHSTKSYTGNTVDVGNPHDHDNDHSNVDRIPPEPPEGSTPGTPKETPGGTTEGTGGTDGGPGDPPGEQGGIQGGPGDPPGGNPQPQPGKAGTGPPPGSLGGERDERRVGPPPGNNNQGETPEGTSNETTTTTVATPVVRTSSPQQVVSSGPQETQSGVPLTQPPLQPLRVTEYMIRVGSVGRRGLPQWIELHNPNTKPVDLKGYTFQYATRRFANHPYKIHTLTLAATEEEEFSIPSGGVALLATQRLPEDQRFPARKFSFSGIEATQVYALGIENVLKRGWVLTDADGAEVHRLGRDAFEALGDPVVPLDKERARVSYHVYPSESPSEPYYYGSSQDIGSPGFYEEPAPAAPSAVKRKRVGIWAALKR